MQTPKYWFPAKRYGWGWGLPCAWQGWVVFAAYFVLLMAGLVWFPLPTGPTAFVIYAMVLSLALMAVCYLKGEPPKWRWGK